MAVLLYYPRVNPPTEILQQALLYWDGIATVVPHDPDDYAAAVQPELTQLRDRGLYTPLFFMRQVMDVLDGPGRREGLNSRVLLEEIQRMAEGRTGRGCRHRPRPTSIGRSSVSGWRRYSATTVLPKTPQTTGAMRCRGTFSRWSLVCSPASGAPPVGLLRPLH